MTRGMLFILLSLCIFTIELPAHAMHKKAKNMCSSSCSRIALKLCAAVSVGCLCTASILNAHHAIVEKTKSDYQKKIDQIKFDHENPCLEVSGTNPTFGAHQLTITPPLCDPKFDIGILEEMLNEQFGKGTKLTARRGPCKIEVIQPDYVKLTASSCTHDPEKAAEISAQVFYKHKMKMKLN
jgi:hypothetical protein